MPSLTTTILELLRDAWFALAGGLVAMVLLALLAQAVRAASSSSFGANNWAREAISTGMTLLILALVAFLGVPALVEAAKNSIPGSAGCGPVMDLSTLAAVLIGGLAAIRVMVAFYVSAVSSAVGASSALSTALIQAGEAIFGMLIASAAIPIATHFLGVC